MRTGLRDNNKGFSLVELIIVIAIMCVLGVGTVATIGIINNAKVKSCAKSIYTSIGRVKTNTLAKEGEHSSSDGVSEYKNKFEVYKNDKNQVFIRETVNGYAEEKMVGTNGVTVRYSKGGGSESTLGATPIACTFDRSSGVVSNCDFDTIIISGGKRRYTIKLLVNTGKIIFGTD